MNSFTLTNFNPFKWNFILVVLLATVMVACDKDDPIPEPTCTDGIQNGTETGVDCGGTCSPCTVAATCTDGIQNGDETGVDCGGSCDPCVVPNKTTGFVLNGTTSSGSALVKYVEELPTGTIDLSDGTDYDRFWASSVYDHALYVQRPDGAAGFSKIVVNGDGEFEEEGIIATISDQSFVLDVKDSQTGVYHDRATPNLITVFNPETLEAISTIDMSEGVVPGDIDQRYQRFMFRDDDVFGVVRGQAGESFTTLVVHQANLTSGSFVGDTQREGNGFSTISYFQDFGQNVTDDAGNLYILDAGNVEGQGIAARINKIPVGSNEIDTSYIFEPAVTLNPANIFLPMTYKFEILPNGKAIAVVNLETPQAAVDIVMAAGGLQNLTNDQINQIFGILFSSASAVWCELDLEALTVTPIADVPQVGVFATGTVFRDGSDVYLPVATDTETAYYKYNPNSGTTEKAFEITGASLNSVYNIANNN